MARRISSLSPPNNQMQRTKQHVTPLAYARAAPCCFAADLGRYVLFHQEPLDD